MPTDPQTLSQLLDALDEATPSTTYTPTHIWAAARVRRLAEEGAPGVVVLPFCDHVHPEDVNLVHAIAECLGLSEVAP